MLLKFLVSPKLKAQRSKNLLPRPALELNRLITSISLNQSLLENTMSARINLLLSCSSQKLFISTCSNEDPLKSVNVFRCVPIAEAEKGFNFP